MRQVVAGQQPSNPPRLERDEFNRVEHIPDASYDTLICPGGSGASIIHLFLHDYDDTRILSFCGGTALRLLTQQDVWSANKKAILEYVPRGKDLKLIWENDPKTQRIIESLRPLSDLATEASLSFAFAAGKRSFNVLSISSNNIRHFQEQRKDLTGLCPINYFMNLNQNLRRLSPQRLVLLGLSLIALLICVFAGIAHYRKASWGDPWQPIGWLLSMLFLLAAFTASPRELAGRFKSLANPKAAFFLFWISFFVISHLWNFRTAPWNGDALFDESGWDLWYLKSYVIGHPYQPAWYHIVISRETLFHYYVWGFLKLFGFNILSYQAALFVIWLTTFIFTLLLVDLFFRSYVVTSVTALVLNFLPFAFIYTFAGYRYPMAVALAVVSLYFLHVGFRNGSPFCLSLGGIAAGLCLASSISGKQYLLGLTIAAPLYAAFYSKSLKRSTTWSSLALVLYGFLAAAAPILLYIEFNRDAYTLYESGFLRDFWHGVQTAPFPVESSLIPSSFGTAFSPYRVLASLFRMCCLFRCHTIGS